jgi:sodium-dependent dicarboxylate transporter 2/3/5
MAGSTPTPAHLCHPPRVPNQLFSLLTTWEAARERPAYRLGGFLAGLALTAAVLALPRPEGLSAPAHGAAAVTLLMGFWWLGGVLPMAVTAMVPLIAFPALGVLPIADAAAPYADPLIFLMMGGFVLAHAMEEVGLHRRLTALLLRPAVVRVSARRVALALMIATAAVSAFVSNTATMVMMLPLALSLVEKVEGDSRTRAAFVLSTAYACSIGGVATIVGTAPNAVFVKLAQTIAGREVRFIDWMGVGVPFVVLAIPVAWLIVNTLVFRVRAGRPLPPVTMPAAGPGERAVLLVIVCCFAAWLTRSPVDLGLFEIPGWGGHLPMKVDDGFVAISAAMLLFLLPRGDVRADAGGFDDDGAEGRFLLSWRRTARVMPWSVLLLLGGGFAMAEGIQQTGLGAWLAQYAGGLAGMPPLLAVFCICVGVSFLSAFTSNTATTQMALPLLGAAAQTAGIDPILWMVPATIAASCDFTLAVGTPPNAIAAEAGGVSQADMAAAGLFLNVACAGIATFVAVVFGGWVFA